MVKSMSIFVAEFEKKILKVYENENENENSTSDNSASGSEDVIKQTLYFATSNKLIGLDTDMNVHFQVNVIDEIVKCIDETAIRGSGFTLARIIELNVQISSYVPLSGSSYIATPEHLVRKKALINVKNDRDEMCFKWAILSALHPVAQNPHRIQNYLSYADELNFDKINYPVNLKYIDKLYGRTIKFPSTCTNMMRMMIK